MVAVVELNGLTTSRRAGPRPAFLFTLPEMEPRMPPYRRTRRSSIPDSRKIDLQKSTYGQEVEGSLPRPILMAEVLYLT